MKDNYTLIAENTMGSAHYDSKKQILHFEFHGIIYPKLGYEVFDAVLEFTKTHKVKGTFHELGKLEGTFAMMNEYFYTVFFPPMIAQVLLCSAVVVSKDIFTQFAVESLIQKMDDYVIQTFKNPEKGYEWVVNSIALEEHNQVPN